MSSEDTVKLTNEFAPGYDVYVSDKTWKGPEIIFDLLSPYLHKDDLLMDLGMGTGLASIAFKNAGLRIYGMDGAEEMIKQCKKKNIAEEIFLSDLASANFHFPDIIFNQVISNAVFHMIGDLGQIFKETSKHLKYKGYFCFTIFPFDELKHQDFIETVIPGIFSKTNNENGPVVFRHTHEYIERTLESNHLNLVSNKVFIGFQDKMEKNEILFQVFLSQKQ